LGKGGSSAGGRRVRSLGWLGWTAWPRGGGGGIWRRWQANARLSSPPAEVALLVRNGTASDRHGKIHDAEAAPVFQGQGGFLQVSRLAYIAGPFPGMVSERGGRSTPLARFCLVFLGI